MHTECDHLASVDLGSDDGRHQEAVCSHADWERFRIPVTSTNRLYLVPHGTEKVVVKVFSDAAHRKPAWLEQLLPHSERHATRTASASQRCQNERRLLAHWKSRNQCVPAIVDWLPSGLPADRTLVMQWVDRPSLRTILQDPGLPDSHKSAVVHRVFQEMASRHKLALDTHDPRLAHLDANTGNVLVAEEVTFRIDLEGICEAAPLVPLLASEVTKLCRWIARDWRPEKLPSIIESLTGLYVQTPVILQVAVEQTCRGPFEWLHRLRDRRKKTRNPAEVTKFDVVDAIQAKRTSASL